MYQVRQNFIPYVFYMEFNVGHVVAYYGETQQRARCTADSHVNYRYLSTSTPEKVERMHKLQCCSSKQAQDL